MNKILITITFTLCLFTNLFSQVNYFSQQTGNPIVPGFFADPDIVEMDGKYYIYSTTVSKYMEPVVWVSDDMQNWTVHDLNITGEHMFWAPCMKKGENGKYYLYHTSGFDFKCHLYIGESPLGPFEKFGKVEEGFDLQIFTDPNNGRVYGTSSDPQSRPRIVEFNSDEDSEGYLTEVIQEKSIEGSFFDYTEGSYLLFHDGWYYMMYSGGKCHATTYNVRVSRSKNIFGPYEDAPNNPILESNVDNHIYGPGHHSIIKIKDQYFICYHRQDYYYAPTCSERQICIDPLSFNKDSWINPVTPTHTGVDFSGILNSKPDKLVNLALGKPVQANNNQNRHEPFYAVDGNFATRWIAGGSGFLTVDLEDVYTIEKVIPYFVHFDYFNMYKISYSLDNQNWEIYFDQSKAAKKGSAAVAQQTIKARYIKIQFIRGEGSSNAALFELEIMGY